MKSVFLQLLLLSCLVLQSVAGKTKRHHKKYILDPPPCKSAPESCDRICIHSKDCPEGLECCSSFCGIICSENKKPKRRKQRMFKVQS
ncbi:PREDICTED: WAP four-disulfide core domain protein 13-like [Chrysochloris asiatica]|uniref:WAP four-disulfide core domain protein 13-like n=1 Tax=Chrysochloris asiatica TaxID=185453 RepID=A0A9B0WKM5_CHRAS|nr:PREDICTED: WAP four-disulfide core domain protein 13-like [Chrysochloris asiatica]